MAYINSLLAALYNLTDRLDQRADCDLAIAEEAARGDYCRVNSLRAERTIALRRLAIERDKAQQIHDADGR